MTTLQAKPIVTNKFWIVENNGIKVGTIQTVDEEGGGVVYVHDDIREHHQTVGAIAKKYNIVFGGTTESHGNDNFEVYGHPCDSKPYNQVFEVQRRLPLYTKTAKSRSFYCAGYYLVEYSGVWQLEFCPKSITLNRYKFQGPYTTQTQADERRRAINL